MIAVLTSAARWRALLVALLLFIGCGKEGSREAASDEHPLPGMVWIEGGEFSMGSDAFEDAMPIHRVAVDGFWIDSTEVTNAQFARFVAATGYVTLAERTPRAED